MNIDFIKKGSGVSMEVLGNNVWLGITNTIYTIHNAEELKNLAEMVLKEIGWIIPYDRAMIFWNGSDKGNVVIKERTRAMNFDDYYIEKMIQNHDRYDCTMGLKLGGNSIVYRESDVVDSRIWKQSSFYKEFCEPNNIMYILQVVLCNRNSYCGNILLFREKEGINAIDFSDRDIFIMNLLKEHLSLGIYRINKERRKENEYKEMHENMIISPDIQEGKTQSAQNEDDNNKLTLSQCTQKYHLTTREEEILKLILDGKDTDEVSELLYIAHNTLKKHIFNIYRKMEIKNRTQLFKMVKEKAL